MNGYKEVIDVQTGIKKPWNWMLFPFCSIRASSNGVFAASVGHGVYEIDREQNWDKLGAGLQDYANIYRLGLHQELLHACTEGGLYEWMGEQWTRDGMSLPCYQYKRIGGACYAATDDGIWIRTGSKWGQLCCEGLRVYDFLNLPQYVIVGHEKGISLYDRFMDEWACFELNCSVTRLAVYRGHVIGASDKGELLVGDKKGRFELIQFVRRFIFSVANKDGVTYVCTDHGLYRLAYIADRLILLAVQTGFPVTDVDLRGNILYMATLFHGVRTIEL